MIFKLKDTGKEHRWFVWWPLKVEGHLVWLEYVIRYKNFSNYYYGGYQYKLIK